MIAPNKNEPPPQPKMSKEELDRLEKQYEEMARKGFEVKGLQKVGVVGVNSGQVMICDPCYIDSEWQDTGGRPYIETPMYRDKKTGKTYAYEGFGIDRKAVDVLYMSWEQPLPDYGGKTPNQCRDEKLWEHAGNWVSPKAPPKGQFSYGGVSRVTLNEPGHGQLIYKVGHPGVGVASRTQAGDGCYPVFAEMDGNGSVARLIIDFRLSDYENDMSAEDYPKALEEMGEMAAGEKEIDNEG